MSEKFFDHQYSLEERTHVREKYNLPEHYILSLSTLQPRKNIGLLIDACTDLFISSDECNTYTLKYPEYASKFKILPTAASIIYEKAIHNNSQVLLYYGSLNIRNNFLSVVWFTQHVLPLIIEKFPYARLKVVGRIDDEDRNVLRTISHNVEVCGYVDNLDAEINEAAIITLPVLYGGGLK